MNFYIIAYDLNAPGKDYSALLQGIPKLFPNYCKILESTYVIYTKHSAKEIYNALCPGIDQNDKLIVSEINMATTEGWLGKDFWAWVPEARKQTKG